MSIIIIDYGLGNLISVYNALRFLKADVKISDKKEDLKRADKIILPGVGASGDAMRGLKERGLSDALKEYILSGGIYLGICLGLQLLFEISEEGDTPGLGVFKGKVVRFEEKNGVKVPHIGWNRVEYSARAKACELFKGIKDNSYFYFDHSYYAVPEEPEAYSGGTFYGRMFTSMIWKNNIYAVQFHPERSQDLGLRLLNNFIKL